MGCPRVKEGQEVVIHGPHAIPLETKPDRQVKKYILNLFLAYEDIMVVAPFRVWFLSTLTGRQIIDEVRYSLQNSADSPTPKDACNEGWSYP
ncbi:hypothetical protein BKA56DRAFT_118204 [Ilyonectria sp. MPI-CAGE-AT-0026]|nr:hypothetical protein BKA56DRAFT_118204 [Ilyonectria sp. MPI-CAGE-AT-0026]